MTEEKVIGGDYISKSFDRDGMYGAYGVPRYFSGVLGTIGFAGVIVILLWFIFRGRIGGRDWGEGWNGSEGGLMNYILPMLTSMNLLGKDGFANRGAVHSLESHYDHSELSKLRSEVAELKAERYSTHGDDKLQLEVCALNKQVGELCVATAKDEKIASLQDQLVRKDITIGDEKLRVELEALKVRVQDNERLNNIEHRDIRRDAAVNLEFERTERIHSDKDIYAYCNCNFLHGEKYLPADRVGRLLNPHCECDNRYDIQIGNSSASDRYGSKTIIKDNTWTQTPTTTITNSADGEVISSAV
jgi:hypothetical protein